MKADRSEQFAVTGSIGGCFIVWDIREGDLIRRWSAVDFESSVLDIFIHDEAKIISISSEEGKIVIYNIYTKELFRVLFHPEGLPVHRLVLSLQPFGSVAIYSDVDGRLLVYSVNGQLLASKKFKGSRLTDLQISQDCFNMEFIVKLCIIIGLHHYNRRNWSWKHALLGQFQSLHSCQKDCIDVPCHFETRRGSHRGRYTRQHAHYV